MLPLSEICIVHMGVKLFGVLLFLCAALVDPALLQG